MEYHQEFKLIIPDWKEEIYDLPIKIFQRVDDVYLISVASIERKSVSFFEEEIEADDDHFTEPSLDLFFKFDFQKLKSSNSEISIYDGTQLEGYESTIYYLEHLYVQNVIIKINYIESNQYEIEVIGETENNHNGGDSMKFYFKDIFEANL